MITALMIPTGLSVVLARSASNNNTPVNNSMAPTNSMLLLNNSSICSSYKTPTAAAGIIDNTILAQNHCCSRPSFGRTNPFKISTMSLRNTTTVLSAVAKCNTTVITMPNLLSSRSTFSSDLAISKCPLLLTGRNSVRPWTIPRRIALIMSGIVSVLWTRRGEN